MIYTLHSLTIYTHDEIITRKEVEVKDSAIQPTMTKYSTLNKK